MCLNKCFDETVPKVHAKEFADPASDQAGSDLYMPRVKPSGQIYDTLNTCIDVLCKVFMHFQKVDNH